MQILFSFIGIGSVAKLNLSDQYLHNKQYQLNDDKITKQLLNIYIWGMMLKVTPYHRHFFGFSKLLCIALAICNRHNKYYYYFWKFQIRSGNLRSDNKRVSIFTTNHLYLRITFVQYALLLTWIIAWKSRFWVCYRPVADFSICFSINLFISLWI